MEFFFLLLLPPFLTVAKRPVYPPPFPSLSRVWWQLGGRGGGDGGEGYVSVAFLCRDVAAHVMCHTYTVIWQACGVYVCGRASTYL
jgi:hypothetical protein